MNEAIEDAPCIRDWLTGAAGPPPGTFRRGLLVEIGRVVGTWHAAGLFHGDLHPGNLLCRMTDAGPVFFWLDTERTRACRRLPLNLRVNDLVKLNYERLPVSLADRMRVWKAYLESSGWPPDRERSLLGRVIARTQHRWRDSGWL